MDTTSPDITITGNQVNEFLRVLPESAHMVWNTPELRREIESTPRGPLIEREMSADYLARASLGRACEALILSGYNSLNSVFLDTRYREPVLYINAQESVGLKLVFAEAFKRALEIPPGVKVAERSTGPRALG